MPGWRLKSGRGSRCGRRSGGKMKDHQLNLLQLINATLSAAVFVSLGEGLAKAFPEPLRGVGPSAASLATAATSAILIIWTIKIFLDDHKTFASADRKLASYISLFFNVFSYLLLIASAATIQNLTLSLEYLALHFLLLASWVLVSILLRILGLEDAVDGFGTNEDMRLRFVWLVLNVVYFGLSLWASDSGVLMGSVEMLPLGLLVLTIIGDAWFSGTFAGLLEQQNKQN